MASSIALKFERFSTQRESHFTATIQGRCIPVVARLKTDRGKASIQWLIEHGDYPAVIGTLLLNILRRDYSERAIATFTGTTSQPSAPSAPPQS